MRRMFTSLAAVALLGLSPSPASARGEPNRLPDGIWLVAGYETVLVSSSRGVQTYYLSTAGCVQGERQTHGAFLAEVGEPAPPSASGERLTLQSGPTLYALARTPELPAACRPPLRTPDALANFDVFAATFEALYPAFDERGVQWAEARADARQSLADGDDLFGVLAALVAPLGDDHVRIEAGDRSYSHSGTIAPGSQPNGARWTPAALAVNLRDFLASDSSPLIAPPQVVGNRKAILGRLPGAVGYLAIVSLNNWAPLDDTASAGAQADAASREMEVLLARLGEIRGLVIDLRINVGGHDAVALAIASRFADRSTTAFIKDPPGNGTEPYAVTLSPSGGTRFTGPVAVLTSHNTVSAGEVLALAMSALPNVTIVGQPTRGAFSDAVPRELPNGWLYTLAAETYLTVNGEALEGRGLAPGTATPAPVSAAPTELWGRDIGVAWDWLGGTAG